MIYIKLKINAPYDSIRNAGTMYETIDGKRQLVNKNGTSPFSLRKGRFVTIPYDWKGLSEVKEHFDSNIFEFFKTKADALAAVNKEAKLLKLLPFRKMEERNARVRKKVLDSRFGQNRPTMDDVLSEAEKIGVTLPKL